jgi:hypothetical protein
LRDPVELHPFAAGPEEIEYAPIPHGFHRGRQNDSCKMTEHHGANLCLFVFTNE